MAVRNGWIVNAGAVAVLLLAIAPAAAQNRSHAGPPDELFAKHRQAFMERMEGGIAIFRAQPEIPRNGDAGYPYRQDSDFYYVTGFTEPGAVAVLRPGAPEGERFVLFVRPHDVAAEIWTGHRAGVEGALENYEADRAYGIDSLDLVIPRYLQGVDRLYFDFSKDHPWAHTEALQGFRAWADTTGAQILGTDAIVNELRLIKGPEEIALLQEAIDITVDAQRAAMAAIVPGMFEYEVEALIEYVFRKRGSPRVGFNSIIGSGPNATILHYEENDRRMEADDMVVMDIGAEWAYYTADVTRTVPVDGEFSPQEAAIYQIVLDAQTAAMDIVRPGATIREIHVEAVEVVTEGLIREGLLEGTVRENIESGAYRRFFMHATSHWLGLDVHDVGPYEAPPGAGPRILEPGMVFTIEPGVYIAEGMEGVDPKWWGIGVRIEDDVLVTESGYRNLSAGAPREIEAIEAIMVGRGVPEVVPGSE
ncbi:MAG TPA: aminopeptidase P N-terminal domain-containing protein [Gemmatimonadota bacterium]|nr:aminopeptidase P N-terminal domain-containing protein [Gemmatimonadota bacterium]